jgi:signal transduction histidine kinase
MTRSLVRPVWPAVALVLIAGLSTPPRVLAQTPARRNVLTIHAGSEFFPANPILDEAIRDVLLSVNRVPIDYYSEYLESDRSGEGESEALAEYVRRKYRDRPIDLVIAVTTESLDFVLDHRETLFPGAPVVFGGVVAPDEAAGLVRRGVAVLRVGSAYVQTLDLALRLHPSTERVFVLARSPNQQNVESARAGLQDFARRVELVFVDEETLARALAVVRAAPPRSLVLFIWHSGENEESLNPLVVARSVAAAAPVPVYGTVDLNIGSGIVGGVVRGTRESGIRLGEMAGRILEGTPAQDIPVEDAALVPTFDWRQIQRWGIDASRLPPESKILFRTPTPWELYRPYIFGAAVVVTAQLLAIAGLLVQRAKRRHAEAGVHAREATIRVSYQRIRQLAGGLINAQDVTRAGIARDLHDGVCQDLAGVAIAVGSLQRSTGLIQDAHAQQAFSRIQSEVLTMNEGIRRLSHELHPSTLRLVGLATALQAHCDEVEKRHDVPVTFRREGDVGDMHPDVAECFFRIAQESLRNALAHGRPSRLSVSLCRSGDQVELTVTDDGAGFDLEATRRTICGLGLVSIEERAYLIGADVRIASEPGKGTVVTVRGPAKGAAARPAGPVVDVL